MIKVLIGNLFESKSQTLVNTVNCVGVMGKGIALEFKKNYPQMYKDYVIKCNNGAIHPGEPYYYSDLLGTSIINFPTKDDWRSQSNISYIINGLKWFIDNYQLLGIKSVAFPPLGCGNGGLLWEDVGPIMYKALSSLPIDIEIYAPFGTKKEQLTETFLSDYKGISKRIGIRKSKLNETWFCILEILYQLNLNKYSSYIGRTMFQKLCYLSTIEGLQTQFSFHQGSYGPYSPQVKEAYSVMANSMLICEVRKGKMDAVLTTGNFEKIRKEKVDLFNKNRYIIEKMIDLFTRIKDTAQAELYTTIIFAYKDLIKNQKDITEKELFDYILKWKAHWKYIEKLQDIDNAIRDLAIMKYISVKYVPGFIS